MDEPLTDPLVFAGGSVLDVDGGEVLEADVAVADGRIDRIGPHLTGGRVVDVEGLTLVPG